VRREDELAVDEIDVHATPSLECPEEDLVGQGIAKLRLEDPTQRPRAK
jgi:hypothetical protein